MTSFMMPHVYGRLMPDNIHLVLTNGYLKPKINFTLSTYISKALKAVEQYSEIWESMCKITNMYESLGEKTTQHYEIQEIFNTFKLSHENTYVSTHSEFNDHSIVRNTINGINAAKKNNNLIIKTGSLFSQVAIDCMYILSLCFNEVYVYKPASCPAVLDEKYIVCRDFKLMNVDYLKPVFEYTLSILEIVKTVNCLSLYTRRINNNYVNTLIEANSVIGQQQLESINNTITLIEQGKKKERIDALKKQQAVKCSEWHKRYDSNFYQHRQESEAI